MEKRIIFGSIAMFAIFTMGALAGCLGGTITESGVDTVLVTIDISALSDTLEIEVISGSGDWSDYRVIVDGATDLTTTATDFSPGSLDTFTDPNSIWDPITGTSYNVKIVDIGDDVTVFESDVIAKA